jgi:hypothetical protein
MPLAGFDITIPASERPPTNALGWVHTSNVTAYRNVVTLQLTDTIRRQELNLHPVPHGVTVSCEGYTVGFPVCYGSPSDVFAVSSGFVHLYTLRFNPLSPELNPICYLLALLAHHFLHVTRIRVKSLTLRLLMSYIVIYIYIYIYIYIWH